MSSTSPKGTKTTTKAASSKKPATAKTAKPAAAKKPAKPSLSSVPPAPQAVVAEPKLVAGQTPVVAGPVMKKKELIDTVVERIGAKKKDVKPVVEAMLAVLGDALAEDRELNLPPFAKLRIQRVKQMSTARVTIAKLRQPTPAAKDAAE